MTFIMLSRMLVVAAALVAVSVAQAQSPTRVRGTIEAVDGNTVSIHARDGTPLKLVLADNTAVVAIEKRSLADIKPGEFIGSGALPGEDGVWHALEVHIFPENMRGTGEGHRPWEQPGSSMTNATVADVVTGVSGNTLTMRYKGGEQKITVSAETPIVAYVPGERSEIKPGKAIFIPNATRAEDGTLHAARISVERTAPPPM